MHSSKFNTDCHHIAVIDDGKPTPGLHLGLVSLAAKFTLHVPWLLIKNQQILRSRAITLLKICGIYNNRT